jgi:argininosuccinate synthase
VQTGKGNDQVRFELTIMALAPETRSSLHGEIWDIKSRQDALDYCIKHDIKLNMSAEESYSKDMNIWHLSHERHGISRALRTSRCMIKFSNDDSSDAYTRRAGIFGTLLRKGIPVALNGESVAEPN